MIKRTASVVLILLLSDCLIPAFGESQDLLEKSNSLAIQGDLYQALVALKPLHTADQRSHTQERAFWQANALCETVVREGEFVKEFEEARKKAPRRRVYLEEPLEQERIVMLNRWGADIGFNPLGGVYEYRYGFLERLLELYPDSERRPAAEYYLIRRGYNDPEPVGKWLEDLYSYVDRNADSSLRELYAACLDIAHINDNLWQLLTHPDGTYNVPFSSGDPGVDKRKAAVYKAEALKYYTRVFISGYGGRFGYPDWFHTRNRLRDLRQDKKTNEVWIIYD